MQSDAPIFSVVQSFSGSTVILTGATGNSPLFPSFEPERSSCSLTGIYCRFFAGYVGKLVLEQLFRTCPGIEKVKAHGIAVFL